MRIVIIGAGVLGASTAFHAARAGASVSIIDPYRKGRATAAGAGIICPWVSAVDDEIFYRLYAAGGDYYPDLVAALAAAGETDLGYKRAGAMVVSGDPQELDWIERGVRGRPAVAMGAVSRLAPADAQALFPPLRDRFGGVLVQGGARVDGRRLAAGLLRAAQVFGATVRAGPAAPVIEAGRVVAVDVGAVDVGDERIPADRLVVTAGAWAADLLRPLGIALPVEPQRGQIVHLRLEDTCTDAWPVILPPGSHYIVPFENGRIVVGATREAGRGFDYRVTAAGQAAVLTEALAIAPGLAEATLIETRVGFRPAGVEIRPLLGWIPHIKGLAVGNGLGAAGLTIGPLAGRLLADLVTEQPGLLDLAPFDPLRRVGAAGPTVQLR